MVNEKQKLKNKSKQSQKQSQKNNQNVKVVINNDTTKRRRRNTTQLKLKSNPNPVGISGEQSMRIMKTYTPQINNVQPDFNGLINSIRGAMIPQNTNNEFSQLRNDILNIRNELRQPIAPSPPIVPLVEPEKKPKAKLEDIVVQNSCAFFSNCHAELKDNITPVNILKTILIVFMVSASKFELIILRALLVRIMGILNSIVNLLQNTSALCSIIE